MAVDWTEGFEGGVPIVGTPPECVLVANVGINTTTVYQGTNALDVDTSVAGSEVTYQPRGGGSQTPVLRFYLRLDAGLAAIKAMVGMYYDAAAVNACQFIVDNTGASPLLSVAWGQTDGTITAESANKATLTLGAYYRLEHKIDATGTGHKVTWGVALGEGSLATLDTNYVGGNTFTAATYQYVRFGTVQGVAGGNAWKTRYDAAASSGSAADYPIGPALPPATGLVPQFARIRFSG